MERKQNANKTNDSSNESMIKSFLKINKNTGKEEHTRDNTNGNITNLPNTTGMKATKKTQNKVKKQYFLP